MAINLCPIGIHAYSKREVPYKSDTGIVVMMHSKCGRCGKEKKAYRFRKNEKKYEEILNNAKHG